VCQLSIYNSFPVIRTTIAKKSSFLRTQAFMFLFPWGRPCGNHAKRCMNEKTIQCLPNPSQHVPIYLEQFPSYSNRKCKKSQFSRTAAYIFVSLGDVRRPCDYHAICCMVGKTIQCYTIRYDSEYLTCSKKLTGSQLSLPHGCGLTAAKIAKNSNFWYKFSP